MAGFDDLIPAAMPYLATESMKGVAGVTWEWSYELRDDSDTAVDMTTGFTGTCVIAKTPGATPLVSPTVTFPVAGKVTCSVTAANTTGLAAGGYMHEVEVTRTSDGKKIKVVGGGESLFAVLAEVGA